MSYRIVAVDDDAISLSIVKNILNHEDMLVTCLRSGEQLLKFMEKNNSDLILLDIIMPEMDGFDTYIALRKYEEHTGRAATPVIFISGENDSRTEEMSLILGASDFIGKPYDRDVLVRRINNSIKNSKRIENLTEEATRDEMTGLLNKVKGTERTAKICRRKNGALMIMDLDSFKLVNDLFGHDKGDQILKAFVNVIRHNSRETDTISRIGGDEFMAFYEDMLDESAVQGLTLRLNRQLSLAAENILGSNHGIPLGISMGVVMVPEYGRDYQTLFSLADSALYKVKHNGKHGYFIYDDNNLEQDDEEDSVHKLDRMIKILEERNESDGALLLGKESFSITYKFIMRFFRRYGGSAALILFELQSHPEDYSDYFMEAVTKFCSVLENALRMSDVVMQNGDRSFFIMLTECAKGEVEKVAKRVIEDYMATEYGEKVHVKYIYKYMEKKS